MTSDVPLGSIADAVLDNLSLIDRSDLLEELFEVSGAEASSKLLDEYGSAITFIFRQLRSSISLWSTTAPVAVIILASVLATVIAATTFAWAIISVGGTRARAFSPAATAAPVEIPIASSVTS